MKLLGVSLMFQSEVLHNGHEMVTRYSMAHWTEDEWNQSECHSVQVLYVCEHDSAPVYRDDSI
jgi:hypothetical protein